MGLDIYLYSKADAEANRAHNEASEAFYGRPDYDELTEEQKDEIRKTIPPYANHNSAPSERYPDHLFNRRYLRSSYNGGGFNHAVPELLGSANGSYPKERGSLDWIFEPVRLEDQYDIELTVGSVDPLRQAKARALEVVEALRASDRLRVLTVSSNVFSEPPTHTDDDALRLYREAVAAGRIQPDGWWSNINMDVFGDGLTVLAAIPGKATFGVPGVHLIYRQRDEGLDSYVQSAEIVAEFCDEAIALIERDGSCSMSWSG
jgi:hypothetical protein